MTRGEAINVLKTRSCYECSWGCDSPVSCHCGGCDLAEATRVAIESLETFGWIPVTERLPEKGGWYLVTWEDQFKTVRGVTVSEFIEPKGLTDIGHFEGFVLREITAWMPLPEPYKEVTE